MNRVKEIERINAKDVALQLASDTVGNSGKWDINKSWHAQYKDSAYVYVGGLPPDLSEGDVVVVFSQFGEIVDVNMPRDKDTGKTRGFAFIGYEDQRSTALAVDNFNGAKLLGRTLRCDHCASYHEEQKKDPAKLPDHVARKLSDAQIEEKKRGMERRNAELDEALAAKAELFAQGRGLETEEEHEERVLREQFGRRKEVEAADKSAGRIAAVLAKRKGDAQREITEETRQQQQREDRKRQRDEEARQRSRPEPPPQPPPATAADGASLPAVSSSRWERFLTGGAKKKNKAEPPRAEQGNTRSMVARGAADDEAFSKHGGEGISVQETNALRSSLGLKPLRGE
jgi:RNA-binding motif protein, X-linked 2